MKRLISILASLIVLAVAIPIFAETRDSAKQSELVTLYQKMAEIRKEIIQNRADQGQITKEQAEVLKDRVDTWSKQVPNYAANGKSGFGAGRRGGLGMRGQGGWGGCGMGTGFGGGRFQCPGWSNQSIDQNSK